MGVGLASPEPVRADVRRSHRCEEALRALGAWKAGAEEGSAGVKALRQGRVNALGIAGVPVITLSAKGRIAIPTVAE